MRKLEPIIGPSLVYEKKKQKECQYTKRPSKNVYDQQNEYSEIKLFLGRKYTGVCQRKILTREIKRI